MRQLDSLIHDHGRTKSKPAKRVGDYLAAELIGERYDEWQALFVPEFVGSSNLLERNITVLTGLRGCGKTMIFRRLTALYDHFLGSSKVKGSDSFLGFYVNARAIAEAFPWLPSEMQSKAAPQILHYFHVCWILEMLEWLKQKNHSMVKNGLGVIQYAWLVGFFKRLYQDRLLVTKGKRELDHLISFFNAELERTRLQSGYECNTCELSDIAFLEKLLQLLSENIPEVSGRPFYLFLDDYSLPLVSATTQHILNAVVFRRSALAVFKIATESVESIELVGLNGKILEEGDDFQLIDSGTEALFRQKSENARIISAILAPRIERDVRLAGRKLTLQDILGKTPYNNVQLGTDIRSNSAQKVRKEVQYHGTEVLCRMWTSNVREIIGIFAEMISLAKTATLKEDSARQRGFIDQETQNKVLKEAGGRFVALLTAATNPTDVLYEVAAADRSFGEHLVNIARAFQDIVAYELLHKTSNNGPNNPPKQARRIEITDVSSPLPDDVADFYRGIIRYGLFVRDHRGKSVRRKAVPRLVLRGLLVPYFTITFSLRDHITMSWEGFCEFLRHPSAYAKAWIANGGREKAPPTQHEGDTLPGL